MVQRIVQTCLQSIFIGLVIIAAAIWARSEQVIRPKHIDAQTLIGGTIWSQTIIPVGLLISKTLKETIDPFIEGFYLLSGVLLLCITAFILIVHETKRLRKIKRRRDVINSALHIANKVPSNSLNIENEAVKSPSRYSVSTVTPTLVPTVKDNAAYYEIGVLCFIAGVLKLCELILFLVLRKIIM